MSNTLKVKKSLAAVATLSLNSTSDERALVPFSVAHHTATQEASKKVMLPTMEGISFEKIKNVLFLEASGNYTLLHFTDGRQILVCRSLCEIESRLPDMAFVRIHRSHTIHLRHVKKYVRGKGGHVVLNNGAVLAVSSGQKDHFSQALQKYFI